jgi:hypothetical protein
MRDKIRLAEGNTLKEAISNAGVRPERVQIVIDFIKKGEIGLEVFISDKETEDLRAENKILHDKAYALHVLLDTERDLNEIFKRDLEAKNRVIAEYIERKKRE